MSCDTLLPFVPHDKSQTRRDLSVPRRSLFFCQGLFLVDQIHAPRDRHKEIPYHSGRKPFALPLNAT